ncbi:putative 3-methyladenine DNA glycosylase isoform X2 [Leptopilina heterotoma]|uniref:putative 3-methyladenine DNA glycosylase isoform X2 n=1 Tax=Leptopilina heterotoma TaxID=63436 RepID=UPI001CA9518D|nr:putative 3-methyladenine DNA glycosylase isoform X2 [Leptopilina heterotoma]
MQMHPKPQREELLVANGNSTQKKNKHVSKEKMKNLEILRTELKQLEDPPVSKSEKDLMSARLEFSFFNKPCKELAICLLGKIFVRQLENGTILKGRIVETECYIGAVDKASITYDYRISSRTLPLYMPPGTIYVYSTYGMYHCLNISSQGDGCAVLIRAIEPIEGFEQMSDNRNMRTKSLKRAKKEFKIHELCNGPAKLCMAYSLTKVHSKYSLCSWRGLWIENDNSSQEKFQVVHCKRIGIEKCDPTWANKPLRFYIYNNISVTKQDKEVEKQFLTTN